MTLLEELRLLLQKDERLISEGKLLKNKIVELALKLDKDLIKLLLSNDKIKKHFFYEVDGILVFDKEKFMKFVDNKEFLPNSYTAFKNKIGLATEDGKYIAQNKEVVLVWPYKDCILEGGQEKPDEKREEIFHNEILAPDEIDRLLEPKVFTNFKRIDKNGEHKLNEFRRDPEINKMRGLPESTITDNLIIKGNNFLVLHSLLKEFRGKVKLIYIDPPYNRGNDEFKYNDNFKHSTWLTFMKNRLEVAKELLKNDGVIAVQIDEREAEYLKIILDEIFGRGNKISKITVKVKDPAGVGQQSVVFDICEYIYIYAKDMSEFKKSFTEKPDLIPLKEKISNYKHFIADYGKHVFVKEIERQNVGTIKIYKCENYRIEDTEEMDFITYVDKRNNIAADYNPSGGMILAIRDEIPSEGLSYIEYVPIRGKNAGQPTKVYFLNQRILSFLSDIIEMNENGKVFRKVKLTNLWEIPNAGLHSEGGVNFRNGKKPELLIYKIINVFSKEDDIILDYHIGSGTTCAVAHKMRRQYIGVEQLDYGENDSVVRLRNVINGDQTGISRIVKWNNGGDFVYMELMKLNEVFVDRIQDAETTEDLLDIWEDMKRNGFLSYRVDSRLFDENIEEFKSLNLEEQKRLLIETLDKNDLYVNYSEIDDKIYNVSEEDKKLNKEFYGDDKDARRDSDVK